MPTGTGKTITFLSAAKQLGKKTLILVHREELLNQTYEKAKLCGYAQDEISLVNSKEKNKISNLTIAMVPTLIRNLDKYRADEVEAMIIDEAHHATAQSYKDIIKHFEIFEKDKYLLGFTATPLRGDKSCLSTIFKSHTFKMTLSEATQQGYIVPVSGMRVEMKKSLQEIETHQGDYDISQLDKVMNCEEINNLVAEKCQNLGKTPGIVFCTSVDHAQEIAKKLRQKKRKAISISYKTTKKTLDRIFDLLRQGRIEFITNAIKLSEGFDHPAISSIIIARPTRSPVLYKQMIGRGLRKYSNKRDCFVLEFTSNDPKMMRWEDIDENSTFQTETIEEKKSREQALAVYRQRFQNGNLKVLDVRISPFTFYECYVRRIFKYKKIYYIVVFQEGFSVIKGKPVNIKGYIDKMIIPFAYIFFWKKELEQFYLWKDGYGPISKNIETYDSLPLGVEKYAIGQKMGKWYPSEEETINQKQKYFIKQHDIKIEKGTSARKAEMIIEEYIIKKIIDKYISTDELENSLINQSIISI